MYNRIMVRLRDPILITLRISDPSLLSDSCSWPDIYFSAFMCQFIVNNIQLVSRNHPFNAKQVD